MQRKDGHVYISDEQYAIALANGISHWTLDKRVRDYDWDLELAITKKVTRRGKYKKWLEIARENGVNPNTFMSRVNKMGMKPEEACKKVISTKRGRPCKIAKKWFELAEKNGISESTLKTRYYRGMNLKEAATKKITKKGVKMSGENIIF